jgi:DNA-binding beta-propeller fold protein YncE
LGASVLVAQWNGKSGSYEVRPVDPATGVTTPGYEPLIVGRRRDFVGAPSLSADGTRLLVVEAYGTMSEPYADGTTYRPTANVLHMIDVQAWRDVTATLPSTLGTGSVGLVTFSPDGGRLALTTHVFKRALNKAIDTLVLVDTGMGKVLLQRELEFNPSLVEFSQDGSQLVAYGQPSGTEPGNTKPGPVRLLLLDASTLETVWDQTLTDILSGIWCESNCDAEHSERVSAWWAPAVVPSPDRGKLYIVHADEDKLTVVDLVASKVRTMEVREARSLLEELLSLTASSAEAKGGQNGVERSAVLSSDGTKLYVVGRKKDAKRGWMLDEPLALRVVSVESGQIVSSSDLNGFDISIAPDETYLYLYGSYVDKFDAHKSWRDVVDLKTLQRVNHTEDEWVVRQARRLGGQPIVLGYRWVYQVTGNYAQMAVLDPRTFEVTASWAGGDYTSWIVRP